MNPAGRPRDLFQELHASVHPSGGLPYGPLGWRGQSGQCAAFRLDRCDIFPAIGALGVTLTAWSWCWRARQRDTAGTAGGRSPGVPCAAADAPGGLPPRGRDEKLPPRNGETSG
jgi:hypothetical protein